MENQLDWQLLDEIATHGQYLQRGLDKHSRAWLGSAQASQQPLLTSWVASQLHARGNLNDSATTQVPAPQLHHWKGWLCHDSGHFAQAHSHFIQAWTLLHNSPGQTELLNQHQPPSPAPQTTTHSRHSAIEAQIALGLGRTHLRTGYWNHARGWLLYGLAVARRTGDEATVFKSYGALGELFIRAAAHHQGFACLNLAYRLLPAGSGQRARQLNYLATALSRLHEPLRAQSVLMTSYHMSKDSGDAISQWHALARLQHLSLKCPPDIRPSPDSLDELAQAIESAPPVARGYWRLAKARAALAAGQPLTHSITTWLTDACADFQAANLPMEQAWAGLWMHHHTADPQAWQAALANVQALMSLAPADPPQPIGVLDHSFEQTPLPTHRAFQSLLQLPANSDSLERLDELFFL